MNTLVVSSWSPSGGKLYGRRWLADQPRFWPRGTSFMVYEEALPGERKLHPSVEVRLLNDVILWRRWEQRFANDPALNGRVPMPDWKTKDKELGYSYLFDAQKFARKVFALHDAARRAIEEDSADLLVWLDGDTRPIGPSLPDQFIPEMAAGADFVYLGRSHKHSETGFLVFRLASALPLLQSMVDCYMTGDFKLLGGWTDSHVFDDAVVRNRQLHGKSITRHPEISECFRTSPLAPYFEHLKGDRKYV